MHRVRRILGILAACGFVTSTHATTITYDFASLGGTQYRYDYTVTNDGSITGNISLFDLLFDPSLYDEASLTNLSDPSLAAEWDQIFLASGLLVPAALDALALNGGIGVGSSVSGFSVAFSWRGEGLPGAQDFEIYDPETFDLLGAGRTQFAPPVSVPEPATLVLFVLGLIGSAFQRPRASGSH
jgi:hypothetical protein